ncbi:MAG TPA: hypothetical protein PLR20_03915 [Syntrophales bacterium]|nr:hypothetical protein [Syntrophales bacterium]HOX93623.1 hypothetical protein [Syntrophales bacterium]HPI57820.1 hypothetical protein [Syntrophales bacterium]HPN25534.1 hypothetical protein [Syntrophales bacterium]HQM28480.1 hypothetical protein [Syntrophales bacterium]
MNPLARTCCAVTASIILLSASIAMSAEKEQKNPVTRYWMSVETQNTSIPGMSQEGMSGIQGMIMGKVAGIGPKRSLFLQLNSPKSLPAAPEANHDIPAGLNMGKTLPLLIPEREKAVRGEGAEGKMEKPKMRMLLYWGCGETVRPGQPRVLDTEKMSMVEFGKAMSGRTGSAQHPPSMRAGWAYAEWPNRKDHTDVPQSGSLRGDHFVHGNYTPDIKFIVGEKHDFMAPVEFTSTKGGLTDSITFQWKQIPTAIGYFAMAIGHNEKSGETIIWSSSDAQEPGYGLMTYLPPADVSRFIREKVVMGPAVTSCSIPRGIFKDAKGAMLQFIGYGDELNIAYPPKPKNSTKPHEYIWTVKLRNKSTGMLPLGQEEVKDSRKKQEEQPTGEKPAGVPEQMKKTLDKIKGWF